MTVVIDASVALKWVIEENDSDFARALIANDALAAPDLLFIECANALRVSVRRQRISAADASAALAAIEATPIRAIPTRRLVAAAHAIAFDIDQTVYDCVYLAAALSENVKLATADEAFARAAGGHAVYRGVVSLLRP